MAAVDKQDVEKVWVKKSNTTNHPRKVWHRSPILCGKDVAGMIEMSKSEALETKMKACKSCLKAHRSNNNAVPTEGGTCKGGDDGEEKKGARIITMARKTLQFFYQWDLDEKDTRRRLLVVADTEGSAYISQITFASVGDGLYICENIIIPRKWNTPSHPGAKSVSRVMQKLEDATKSYDQVLILFHNGRGHDEELLKREMVSEGYTLPDKFFFGDSVLLMQRFWKRNCIPSFSEEKLYLTLMGKKPLEEGAYKLHRSDFDTLHLRKMIRFLIAYVGVSARDWGGVEVDRWLWGQIHPDMPLGDPTEMTRFMDWLWHEHSLPAATTPYQFTWKKMSEVKEHKYAFLPDGDTQPTYASKWTKHYATCATVIKNKLVEQKDASVLAKLAVCQKCAIKRL